MEQIRNMRLKWMIAILSILTIALIIISWYSAGEDYTLKKKDIVTKLSINEATREYKSYNKEKGLLLRVRTMEYQRYRTKIPFVYKKDTIKDKVSYTYETKK